MYWCWRMILLTVKDIIRAHEVCFLVDRAGCGYCKHCPIKDIDCSENCQETLAQLTINKLNELVELLDDKANHH